MFNIILIGSNSFWHAAGSKYMAVHILSEFFHHLGVFVVHYKLMERNRNAQKATWHMPAKCLFMTDGFYGVHISSFLCWDVTKEYTYKHTDEE